MRGSYNTALLPTGLKWDIGNFKRESNQAVFFNYNNFLICDHSIGSGGETRTRDHGTGATGVGAGHWAPGSQQVKLPYSRCFIELTIKNLKTISDDNSFFREKLFRCQ